MLHKNLMNKFVVISILILSFSYSTIFAENFDNNKLTIDSLIEKSKSFQKSNFDSTYFYANRAQKLSYEFDYLKGKINVLSVMADANLYLNDMDSSITLSQQIIELTSETKQYGESRFAAFYRICRIYHFRGEYSNALQTADNALKGLDPEQNKKYFSMILNLKGLIFKRTGKFEMAQEQFVEALKFIEENNHYLQSITLTNLGIVNRNLKQYKLALDYYDRAIENSKAINDSIGIAQLYQNIAAVYSDSEENRKSLTYNLMSEKIISNKNNQNIYYATLLNNIGLNYEGLNRPDSAIRFLDKALKLSIELEDSFGIADTKINLGRLYLKSGKAHIAQKLVEEGKNIALKIAALDLLIEAYKVLIDYEIIDGNYKSAFDTQKLLIALHDSVYNIEKVNAINELQEKYESEKKQQRIVLLETENNLKDSEAKQHRMQRNGLIGLAILIALTALIILYYLRKTRKAKNKIEILQREIHHRVKNNLAIILRLADVSKQKLSDESAKSAIVELISRIESMAQVHSQLYRKTDITEVNLKHYLNELGKNIKTSFSQENIQLTQEVDDSICVGFNKAVPLGLITNELLTNAFKYAKNSTGIKIAILAKTQTDKMLLTISDNGQGLPNDFDLQKVNSYGLKLVSGLVQQLNGTVKFYNKNGTVVEVLIPA